MICKIMKDSGNKAYLNDLERLERSLVSDEITIVNDVNYAGDDDPEHTLDICFRKDGKLKPVLIDIHGGGFISHDKKVDSVFANVMAQKGFVVFALNYRLAYPEHNVFDQIEDIDKASRWVVNNASVYEGSISDLFIAGHSSGGVNAVAETFLCIDFQMRSAYGLADRNFRYSGLILDCGLMHFYKNSVAYNGMRDMVFPKGYKNDPRYGFLVFEKNGLISRLPKTAIITNDSDELKNMSYYFDELLAKKNVSHKLFDKGSEGHMGIVFKPVTDGSNLMDDVIAFLIDDINLVKYDNTYKQHVFEFTGRCFEELGKKFEPSGRHAFYNDIENAFEAFYCLIDKDNVIGTVALKKIDEYTVELKALYLDSSYRGKGLGSRLINKVIDEAKNRGFKSMVLDSMSQYKDALRLYEKCGFEDTERYNDNAYADVFMKLEL